MRIWRRMSNGDADRVIDLRERLAPYVDLDEEAFYEFLDELDPLPPEPLLTGPTRRVRPLRAVPYEPRHLST